MPLMFGTFDPKESPIASMSASGRTPGNSFSSDMTSRPRVCICEIWFEVSRPE
jgi:hypothetical protein